MLLFDGGMKLFSVEFIEFADGFFIKLMLLLL
jgi:hypothetical protein